MIEIFNIILQFIIFLSLFSFPLCLYKDKIFLLPNSLIINSTYLKMGINIIIHANILLAISFVNIDTQLYFYIIILLSILANIIFILDSQKFKFDFNDLLIFVVFIIFVLGLFFKISIDLKLEWDGLNHWFPKALNFFNDLNIKNLNELGFSEYPHLGPYIWAFFWKNSYLQYEYFGRLFYVYFYAVSLFCVFENQFNKNIILKIILIFLLSIITFDSFLFGGYQGYLIFSTLIILSRFMYEEIYKIKITNRPLLFYFFIIYIFHAIIWFKDEAIFYYMFTLIIFIFFLKINKKYLLYLLCLSFVILQFILQKFLIGSYGFQAEIINDSLFDSLKPNIFFGKFLLISKYILISIIKYKLWIINLFSLLTLYLFFKEEFSKLKMWFYILIINIIFVYAIYMHTPYDLEFLLKVTLDRILFHTSGFYLVFTVILLKRITFQKDNL